MCAGPAGTISYPVDEQRASFTRLARIIHEARREGGKSAAVSGPSDRSRPEAYFQYVEDRRREKVPEMQCYCRPQQSAHE